MNIDGSLLLKLDINAIIENIDRKVDISGYDEKCSVYLDQKSREKERRKIYSETHKEYIRLKDAERYQKNSEKIKAKSREYYAQHKESSEFMERKRAKGRAYYDKIKDSPEYKERRRAYREMKKQSPGWREHKNALERMYRARKKEKLLAQQQAEQSVTSLTE